MSDDRSNLARKLDDHELAWERPEGKVLSFPGKPQRRNRKRLETRSVDVFDGAGDHIATYQVCLEDEGCLECEFEEVALVFAEQSRLVPATQIRRLAARCHRDV
ncbi:MAG TPA: hypothetical protein VHL34_09125 [Rhizomicrobium sp.]|jgi:hypothetical protein|nr:hypothetical protein [Rhizomicrobium sp.]